MIQNARGPIGRIQDQDAVVLFNYRGDRALEISQAFENPSFSAFARKSPPAIRYAGMMQYDGDEQIPKRYLVAPPKITRTLSEYLVHQGIGQFACSETQKFGHVTYFWNGNRSAPFDTKLEEWVEIPSDSGDFAKTPQMKAKEITDATVKALLQQDSPFLRINYANGDMVGHTGKLKPALQAVETVDQEIGRLLDAIKQQEAIALITADHGNAEDMTRTSHTLNPVPLHLYAPSEPKLQFKSDLPSAGLANLAATLLTLLGFVPPNDYEPNLISL